MSARSWLPWRFDPPEDLTPPVDLPSGIAHAEGPVSADGKVLSGYVRLSAADFESLVVRARAGDGVEELEKQLDQLNHENAELTQALDTRRPAADPAVLGPLLADIWGKRPLLMYNDPLLADRDRQAWEKVAETAIDHVRGLWPVDEPAFHGPSCTCPLSDLDVAALDAEADRRLCSVCEHQAHRPLAGACNDCDSCPGERPTDVAGSSEEEQSPSTSWAGEPPAPGDPTLARRADQMLEDLAVALGRRAVPDSPWHTLPAEFQAIYRAYVDVVINEGWQPPREVAT